MRGSAAAGGGGCCWRVRTGRCWRVRAASRDRAETWVPAPGPQAQQRPQAMLVPAPVQLERPPKAPVQERVDGGCGELKAGGCGWKSVTRALRKEAIPAEVGGLGWK